jgi:hypothetical protein
VKLSVFHAPCLHQFVLTMWESELLKQSVCVFVCMCTLGQTPHTNRGNMCVSFFGGGGVNLSNIKAHVSYCQVLLPVLKGTANFVPSVIKSSKNRKREHCTCDDHIICFSLLP